MVLGSISVAAHFEDVVGSLQNVCHHTDFRLPDPDADIPESCWDFAAEIELGKVESGLTRRTVLPGALDIGPERCTRPAVAD